MSDNLVSRRNLLSAGVVIGSTVALGNPPAEARSYSGEIPWTPGEANAPTPIKPGPFQFLTQDEVSFLDAAVARLIPADDLGPGAKEAGVTTFLDRQLAGAFGKARAGTCRGPGTKGEETQGYQSRMTPAAALSRRDQGDRRLLPASKFGGKTFAQLTRGSAGPGPDRPREGRGQARGRRRQSLLRRCFCRTPSKASSPIRSTAAIATWSAGS